MLSRLSVQDFTVLHRADFKFVSGINAIIGSNGAGKSHVLKLAYTVALASYQVSQSVAQNKQVWRTTLAERLVGVFRPDSLGRLARRMQGRTRAEVTVKFTNQPAAAVRFEFSTASKSEVTLLNSPTAYALTPPVFIPAKEVLSLFPNLRGLVASREVTLDETYPDLCDRLDHPLLKGPRLELASKVLPALQEMMDGTIKLEGGRFYFYPHVGGKMEIDLVAEGIRKLALLAYLLGNGSLNEQTTLFWDEPEANLNPLLIEKLAPVLWALADAGIQLIFATHSLYLLRELDIIHKQRQAATRKHKATVRFFSLGQTTADTDATAPSPPQTVLDQEEDLEKLSPIPALDAEIAQTDRYMHWLNSLSHAR